MYPPDSSEDRLALDLLEHFEGHNGSPIASADGAGTAEQDWLGRAILIPATGNTMKMHHRRQAWLHDTFASTWLRSACFYSVAKHSNEHEELKLEQSLAGAQLQDVPGVGDGKYDFILKPEKDQVVRGRSVPPLKKTAICTCAARQRRKWLSGNSLAATY